MATSPRIFFLFIIYQTILELFSPPQPRIHFSLNLSSFHPDQPDAHQYAQLRPRLS
ncbi:hypothetical protein OS493_004011 [Desmophyllum pertusum]|uniref:Uncharacterized protein n=1 Tax=Desmophyllum pertusum TaxID=174260 RepID=A0A9W9ZSR6_9CNID|nr:hypothetical protein OS493_004011 [Desmophyllum pertusum]